ncbi:MAG TPA: serine/threonine-protein kinase, partial [Kofleriaceae bacterium]|nr:serine/threonine-protein kinase [Kofleriaceae bacterium]
MPVEDMDVDADLPPGTQVGEYTVETRLGAGAFGVVYKASHPVIGKLVAIKVLSLKFSVDPEASTRFVAEARAVNQIRHRHIIDIFSFGKLPDGRQYYVMEYLDGETMDALLGRERKLSLEKLLPIARGIAKALDAAHAKQIAHRDLKPENVFLARDEVGVFPKLLDFGIAKLLGNEQGGMTAKTKSGIAVGTPYFMSPEQARGRELDHRTDVYSFGVLVYLSLTGTYPFDGEDHISILMQHVTADPDAPSTRAPELPPAVDEVVLQLLQKDPAARPDSLRSAVAALERAAGLAASIDTGPVALQSAQVAVPAAPTAFVEAPKRRPRTWVLVPALAAVAVIGVAVVALTGKRHEKPPARREPPPAPVVVHTLPPSPPPAPGPAPAPAPPPPVTLDITGVPKGSTVLVAGKVIGTAPGPVQLPQSASATVVVVQADGYQPLSTIVVPDRDQPLALTLKKKP